MIDNSEEAVVNIAFRGFIASCTTLILNSRWPAMPVKPGFNKGVCYRIKARE
jgi:hypothetical protein